jgi:hypothetical protein
MANPLTIYRDVYPVLVSVKKPHIHKMGGRVYNHHYVDYGDVPVGTLNEVTGLWEPVVNLRGRAYATRNRKQFRKKK